MAMYDRLSLSLRIIVRPTCSLYCAIMMRPPFALGALGCKAADRLPDDLHGYSDGPFNGWLRPLLLV